jgi:hypothetical protein
MDTSKIHLKNWASKSLAERPVHAQKAVLLNTIPLFEPRYLADLKQPSLLSKLSLHTKKRRDFVFRSLYLHQSWEEYDAAIATPVLSELVKTQDNTPATIDLEVSWAQFQKAVLSGLFEAFFLFAHHFDDKIEFADGGIEISKVDDFLTRNKVDGPRHFVFMVCRAEAFEKSKIEFPESISSVATVGWNIPVIEAYVFSRFWVQNMDGERSFSEAYGEAIGQYLNSVKY